MFVSMTNHDLLSRTTHYHMRNYSPLRHSDDVTFTGYDDNTDEYRPLSRRRDSGANRSIPPPISNSMPRTGETRSNADHTSISNENILVDARDESNDTSGISYQPENLGFRVDTTCEDPTSDEEEPSSAATLADLRTRDRLPPAYEPTTDEETEDSLERAMRRAGRGGLTFGHRRSRRRAEPRQIDVETPLGNGTGDINPAKLMDVLPPHATFFIEKDRSVVSIKFDPPV